MRPAVLFVDDSALARAVTGRRLAALGFTVTAVGSAREAEQVETAGIAAALLDVELGDGLGTDVARRLRALAPLLPIAFLTACEGDDASALREEALRFGPVFSKLSEVDDALRWIARQAAPGP
jgi:CheY-like chemotaxis protein